MNSRLDTIDPALARIITDQTTTKQRAVALAVAEWVTRRFGLDDSRIQDVLVAGRNRQFGAGPEREALRVLVEELDERAWNIQDQDQDDGGAETQAYLEAFSLARAADASWCSLELNATEAALETVYEAQAATGEVGEVQQVVLGTVHV